MQRAGLMSNPNPAASRRLVSTTARPGAATNDAGTGPKRAKRSRTEADDSEDGSLVEKVRHRVTRACQECRKRKDRCDGQRPSCAPCLSAGRACSYEPSKKRGLRSGYVRAIEILLGLVFNTIDGSDAWICGLLQGHLDPATLRRKPPDPTSLEDLAADTLLDAWRKGPVVKQIERLLAQSGAEDAEDDGDFDVRIAKALSLAAACHNDHGYDLHTSPPFDDGVAGAPLSPMNTETTPGGPTSYTPDNPATVVDSLLSAERPMSSLRHAEAIPYASPSRPGPGPVLVPNGSTKAFQDPGSSKLPENWPHLLDVYYSTTHCWLPLSPKHELMRTAYTLAHAHESPPDSASNVSPGDAAYLHGVLLYASHQSQQAHANGSNTMDITRQPLAVSFRCLTEGVLFSDPSTYGIGQVRCLLVMALFEMDREQWTTAWRTIGRCIYTAISTGYLTRHGASVVPHPPADDGVRRTLLSCFILETIIAARLNTKPFFQSSDVTSIGVLQVEGLEEWEPWQPRMPLRGDQPANDSMSFAMQAPGHVMSTFNRLLEHMRLLNAMLHQHRGNEGFGNIERGNTLRDMLHTCEQTLGTAQEPLSVMNSMPPQLLSLRLASAAFFESSLVELMTSPEPPSTRRDQSWATAKSICQVLESRLQSMGRCAMSPISACLLTWLNQSLDYQLQQLQTMGPGFDPSVQELQASVARVKSAWQASKSPSSPERLKASVDDRRTKTLNIQISQHRRSNVTGQTSQPMRQPQPNLQAVNVATPGRFVSCHESGASMPFAVPGSDISHSGSGDQMRAHTRQMPAQPPQGVDSVPIRNSMGDPSPAFDGSMNFDSLPDSFQDDMEDDGLFSSLATLDSADWLANPPEFMKHLGVLGSPPSDLGVYFDTTLEP